VSFCLPRTQDFLKLSSHYKNITKHITKTKHSLKYADKFTHPHHIVRHHQARVRDLPPNMVFNMLRDFVQCSEKLYQDHFCFAFYDGEFISVAFIFHLFTLVLFLWYNTFTAFIEIRQFYSKIHILNYKK
jgi:hypothetical protein